MDLTNSEETLIRLLRSLEEETQFEDDEQVSVHIFKGSQQGSNLIDQMIEGIELGEQSTYDGRLHGWVVKIPDDMDLREYLWQEFLSQTQFVFSEPTPEEVAEWN